MDEQMRLDDGVINMNRLLTAVWRKMWLPFVCAVLMAAVVLAGTHFFVTPLYQASAMFYVNNGSVAVGDSGVRISSGDINASKSLVETYIVILNTRATLSEVNERAGTKIGYTTLREMIQAEAVNETEIFRVTVTSSDPDEAAKIANAIAAVLPDRISNIVEGSLAKVVDPAVRPNKPSSPDYANNVLLGFLLGAVFGVGIIAVQELLSVTIREEGDIKQICSAPVLAAIPNMSPSNKDKVNGAEKKEQVPLAIWDSVHSFAASEAYNLLRTNLRYSFAKEESCRVIAVTSAISGEGKSTTAVNLAYSLSLLGKKVLLLDCDMRKPTVAEKLKLQKMPGLSSLLTGQKTVADVMQTFYAKEGEYSFSVIAGGQTPPNPAELLSSQRMSAVLQSLRKSFDYVLLDLPPVCEVSDALAVKQWTDGNLFVVCQNRCSRIALKDALRRLEYVDAKLLGIVFNSAETNGGKYGYGRGKYGYYGYRYARKDEISPSESKKISKS